MTKGVFEIDTKGGDNPPDIRPKKDADAIPEDQAKLQARIYATYRVLSAIEEWRPRILAKKGCEDAETTVFPSFRNRLLQVAKCGLVGDKVKTAHGASALEQIRDEIADRMGRKLKFRYLGALAAWAAVGAVVGVLLIFLAGAVEDLQGYGWVLIGAMVGTWISFAATRRTVDLEELPGLLGRTLEPIVRLLYVGLIALVVAILLQREVITIKLGNADLKAFATDVGLALLVGIVSGLAERTLTDRVTTAVRGSAKGSA